MTLRQYIENIEDALKKVKDNTRTVKFPAHDFCNRYLQFAGDEPFGRCEDCPIAKGMNLPYTSACGYLWDSVDLKGNFCKYVDGGMVHIKRVTKEDVKIESVLKKYIKKLKSFER